MVLSIFQCELPLEYTIFLNTLCEVFGEEITRVEDVDLAGVDILLFDLRDPTCERARDRLNHRFQREQAAQVFIHAVELLMTELRKLGEILPELYLDTYKDVVGMAGKIQAMKHIQARSENPKTLKRMAKKLGKNFKLATLTGELSTRIERIRKINQRISTLADGAQRLATTRTITASKKDLSAIRSYYRRVRHGAQSVCNSLQNGIPTPHVCEDIDHDISLCLEMRDVRGASPKLKAPHASIPSSELYFKIIFSTTASNSDSEVNEQVRMRIWKELEVEPINVDDDEDVEDQELANTSPKICTLKSDSQRASASIATCSTQRPTTPRERIWFRPKFKFLRSAKPQTTTSESPAYWTRSDELSPNPPTPATNQTPRSKNTSLKPETQIIQNICLEIQKSKPSKYVLGFLKCDPGYSYPYHRIWSMPFGGCFDLADQVQCANQLPRSDQLQNSAAWNYDPVPLCDLFNTHPTGSKSWISTHDRLSLGIKLASPVIQLHQTLWLDRSWSKVDIMFFIDPWTNYPLINNPLVRQKLNTNSRTPLSQVPTTRSITCRVNANNCYSEILFSLGILLCELWYWKCLENFDFPDAPEAGSVQWSKLELIGAASLALGQLYYDAPILYCQAVEECLSQKPIKGPDEFVQNTWEKIVCPLAMLMNCY